MKFPITIFSEVVEHSVYKDGMPTPSQHPKPVLVYFPVLQRIRAMVSTEMRAREWQD